MTEVPSYEDLIPWPRPSGELYDRIAAELREDWLTPEVAVRTLAFLIGAVITSNNLQPDDQLRLQRQAAADVDGIRKGTGPESPDANP